MAFFASQTVSLKNIYTPPKLQKESGCFSIEKINLEQPSGIQL